MEFAFTDEQAMIAETAQAFFAENATSERTRAAMETGGIDRQLWTAFCQELGLGGILVPEKHGGAGLGHVELAIIAEAAGAQVAALPLLNLKPLHRPWSLAGGSEDQKQKWLPKLDLRQRLSEPPRATTQITFEGSRLNGQFRADLPHGGLRRRMFILAHPDQAWIVEKDGAPGLYD